MTLKNYFFTTSANHLMRVEALDEEMALAYKKTNSLFMDLCEKDEKEKIYRFSEDEDSCTTQHFSEVPNMTRVTKFIDDFIGVEYEAGESYISVYDLTQRDYELLKAFLHSTVWKEEVA